MARGRVTQRSLSSSGPAQIPACRDRRRHGRRMNAHQYCRSWGEVPRSLNSSKPTSSQPAGTPRSCSSRESPGLGKSRLVDDFRAWLAAAPEPPHLLAASAFEVGAAMPFQPLADAIRRLFANARSRRPARRCVVWPNSAECCQSCRLGSGICRRRPLATLAINVVVCSRPSRSLDSHSLTSGRS